MSVNIKLGNDTINGVNYLKVKNANNPSEMITFAPTPFDLNIHYSSTTPPTDTSKLWVKTDNEPSHLNFVKSTDIETPLSEISMQQSFPASVDNKAVEVNGDTYWFYNTTCYKYTPETNAITTIDITHGNNAVSVLGDDIYMFGGRLTAESYYNGIRKYNTKTGNLSILSNFDGEYAYGSAVTVGKKIYVFGGYKYYSSSHNYSWSNAIKCYDTETNTLTTFGSVGYASLCGIVANGSKIYLFGGFTATGAYDAHGVDYIRCYNIEDNTLTTLTTTLPSGNYGFNVVSFAGKALFFNSNKLYEFDFETETLTQVKEVNAESKVLCLVNNTLYYRHNNSKDIYKMILKVNLSQNNMLIIEDSNNKSLNLISGDILNVSVSPDSVYLGDSNNEAQKVDAALYNSSTQTWENI